MDPLLMEVDNMMDVRRWMYSECAWIVPQTTPPQLSLWDHPPLAPPSSTFKELSRWGIAQRVKDLRESFTRAVMNQNVDNPRYLGLLWMADQLEGPRTPWVAYPSGTHAPGHRALAG